MPRASRAQAQAHREEVVTAAAAMVRRDGVDGMTVPQVMAAAGLTHGGFYRHFTSKDDLVAQACAAACAEKEMEREQILAAAPDEHSARRTFIARYLSPIHRDTPSQGCGLAALAADVARAEPDAPVREVYLDGLRAMIDDLSRLDGREPLVETALLAGALMLARAAAGDPLSDRILTAAKDFLLDE
ncbi:TetR/AcrR family transcriptional regulator [Nocardia alni]|uniref:TetR/AcrR family transcriptional regulator n=1 Tax=Nocardia alni TaxID=2815723 RepID=UPI001C23AB52|nr:TetR/AcrR family transcriptional regulator [Nocardia alni]